MIIKARAGKGGQALADYLESGKNEHAEVLEYRNMAAPSLRAAIYMMDMLAKDGNTQNHAYHVQMRAAHGERLSADTWRDAVDRMAEAFGMEQHAAAVVLHHQQDGATHCHVVFNRVHPETLKAAALWQDRIKCKEIARQLEIDYGLQIVTNEKTKQRDHSRAGHPETEQARRMGENVHEIRDRIKSAWEKSDNGQSFSAALEAEGFTLAAGDRRDFVAVDENGNPYSIGKRTTGASPADIKAKLADLDRENVPSVQAVKIELELAAEEEAKLEKERKGRGEATAAAAPAPDWNEAQHSNDRPRIFYADPQTNRAAQWEAAAAARIERLREQHAKEYEQQQKDFYKAADLETGGAVKHFNHLQRCDETNALLKIQAEELAQEYQRQQIKREDYAAAQIWKGYSDELRDSLKAIRQSKPQFRQGGFKQHLREELTRQKNYTQGDALREEQAREKAARERQEQARRDQATKERQEKARQEPQPEKTQATSAKDREAAEQEARIMARRQKAAELKRELDGGRELKP